MSKDINFNLKAAPEQLLELLGKVSRYKVVLFIALLAGVYGFLFFKINGYSNVAPSSDAQPVVKKIPRIDPSVVQQLQQLQDNSVSVKALFDQARSNPFQE